MNSPEISVVMSVYNGAKNIDKTLRSILTQSGPSFEFVVINDGSTDDTEKIVRQHMGVDSRIKLINQSNKGITASLIVGCERASGKFIARQDAGDHSLPGRLAAQYDRLQAEPTAVMCSTATLSIAPDGEPLSTIALSDLEATNGLKKLNLKEIKGPPHHGSVMFRKSIYDEVGGYRKEFRVAQDLDLWTRMVEHGSHVSLPTTYYVAKADKRSITSTRRSQQIEAAQKILECCRARRHTGSDRQVLESLSTTREVNSHMKSEQSLESDFYYFIGAILSTSNSNASAKYFRKALCANPLNLKAALKLIQVNFK